MGQGLTAVCCRVTGGIAGVGQDNDVFRSSLLQELDTERKA